MGKVLFPGYRLGEERLIPDKKVERKKMEERF